ncbi:MAG: T9SS type A sorting domain-containing protein [Saprospiraceae bacterium]|nr:T9SS type A sorting domain-containing protein [Saprospiraceae bacterium]
MKQTIIFCLAFALHSLCIAQIECTIDTAFINSGALVSPTPFVNDTLGEGITVEACIDMPYAFEVFLHAPDTLSVPTLGGITVNVGSIQIADVSGLPEGLQYDCSFEDCRIPGGEIGCLRLTGTPTEANDTGSYTLFIQLSLDLGIGIPLSATFPDTTGLLGLPEGSYALQLNPAGSDNCDVTLSNRYVELNELNIWPNPVQDRLEIRWDAPRNGNTSLQILDATGQIMLDRSMKTDNNQQSQVNLELLPPGIYFVGIRSGIYRSWKKVQKL